MLLGNFYYFVLTFLVLASVSTIVQLWFKAKWLKIITFVASTVSSLLMLVSIILRAIQTGRLPYNSVYEFTLVFSFVLVAMSLVLMARFKLFGPVAFILPISTILFAATFGMSTEITNLMPALQSKWRGVHITTAIVAYSCFAVSFGTGLYFLITARKRAAKKTDDNQEMRLDSLIQNFVIVGFIFLTLLLVTGAIWAEEAWGSWWTWDPKETWALITWLIYAVYLHLHKRQFWKGTRGCYLVVIGFLCVIFTLFGVTFLMGGLHSYK